MNMNSVEHSDIPPDNKPEIKEIFEFYYSRLCYFAFKMLGDEEKAKDVVQDAFVVLWNKMADFDNETATKNFLYLSVKNACLNLLRHNAVKQKFITTQDSADFIDEKITANIILAEVNGEIHKAIETLPAGCKNVLKLSYFEGLKNQEIADALNISINTVKTQKARALQILRLKLDKFSFLLLLGIISQA